MAIFEKTFIDGVVMVSPTVFGDDRGYFMETYSQKDFEKAGLVYHFVQDNQSKSHKGVLRGLHYQICHPQTKLVRVLFGKVFDVAVDLRKGSKTYGQYLGATLSGENKKMLLIPKGFAHGFVVLSKEAVFSYKCDDFYHPEDEGGIMWNDPGIGIKWPSLGKLELSEKDKHRQSLSEKKVEFIL